MADNIATSNMPFLSTVLQHNKPITSLKSYKHLIYYWNLQKIELSLGISKLQIALGKLRVWIKEIRIIEVLLHKEITRLWQPYYNLVRLSQYCHKVMAILYKVFTTLQNFNNLVWWLWSGCWNSKTLFHK